MKRLCGRGGRTVVVLRVVGRCRAAPPVRPLTRALAERIFARCTTTRTAPGRRGSPPSSTTCAPTVSGSTTSGWPGSCVWQRDRHWRRRRSRPRWLILQPEGPRPAEPGFHRHADQYPLRRGHHQSADHRRQPVPGHGDDCCGRADWSGRAIADHMHRTRRGRPQERLPGCGQPDGAVFHADHGESLHLKGLRELCTRSGVTQSMGGGGPVPTTPGGIVQRHPQARDPARPVLLAGRGELPARGVPVAGPLQHQTTALPMPLFQSRDLRKGPDDRYAARSCV